MNPPLPGTLTGNRKYLFRIPWKGATTIYAIGKRIKDLRLAKGITQEELGHALGTGQKEINRIESSELFDLNLSVMRRLSEVLDVFPVTLLYETVEEFWRDVASYEEPEGRSYLSTLLASPGTSELLDKDIGESGVSILSLLSHINRNGMDQAKAYIEDLTKIDDYRRPDPYMKPNKLQTH